MNNKGRIVKIVFGILILIGGLLFLNEGSLTGRVTEEATYSDSGVASLITILGMFLIIIAGVLIIRSIVKEE